MSDFQKINELKNKKLYDWQTDFRKIDDPIIDILAPLSLKTRKNLYEQLKRLTNQPIVTFTKKRFKTLLKKEVPL